jgi:diguanylate cyclase (GGDEF)-like protein
MWIFKKFNDTHGHDAGDMVLRAVGSVLQQDCDGDDVACRPGGEEFTVILPKCDRETALERAERLRRTVENIKVRYGEKTLPRITISVGVSLYPEHGAMPQLLLRSADDALYEAKAQGRNMVVLAEGGGTSDHDCARLDGPQGAGTWSAETPVDSDQEPDKKAG